MFTARREFFQLNLFVVKMFPFYHKRIFIHIIDIFLICFKQTYYNNNSNNSDNNKYFFTKIICRESCFVNNARINNYTLDNNDMIKNNAITLQYGLCTVE
jgi:hypothetical protein